MNHNYKELNRTRAILSHDKFKNNFLNKIGTIRSDLALNERSTQILKVWSDLRGEGNLDDLEAIKDTVRQGLSNWQCILSALIDFFENVPGKFGYHGTSKFVQVKYHLFENPESITSVITYFVSHFDEIGMLKDEAERNKWLNDFWNAADSIHKTLSEMRPGMADDALFGDYFKKI